jgi:hypothetical protein
MFYPVDLTGRRIHFPEGKLEKTRRVLPRMALAAFYELLKPRHHHVLVLGESSLVAEIDEYLSAEQRKVNLLGSLMVHTFGASALTGTPNQRLGFEYYKDDRQGERDDLRRYRVVARPVKPATLETCVAALGELSQERIVLAAAVATFGYRQTHEQKEFDALYVPRIWAENTPKAELHTRTDIATTLLSRAVLHLSD